MICKIRAVMKQLPAPLIFALLCSIAVPPAHAEKADRDKPMNIEADSLRYDDIKQTSVFTGRVVLTKGTIVIRGARVEVRQDADGHQYGVVTASPEAPAYYRQKREGLDEYMEGVADSIEYDGRADRVRLVRNAQLRRLRGTVLADEMNGNLIVYDHGTDVFTVDGGAPAGNPSAKTIPATTGGRVRAVLTPRSTPAGAAIATPLVPPELRPSTTLGGERK